MQAKTDTSSAAALTIACLVRIASGNDTDPQVTARDALHALSVPFTTVRRVQRCDRTWLDRKMTYVGVFDGSRGIWCSDEEERWAAAPDMSHWIAQSERDGAHVKVLAANDTEHLVRVGNVTMVITEH